MERTTDDILKDIKAKIEELESPHKRFFRFGVKRYGIPSRRIVRELRPLVTEYYRLSLKEEKALKDFE